MASPVTEVISVPDAACNVVSEVLCTPRLSVPPISGNNESVNTLTTIVLPYEIQYLKYNSTIQNNLQDLFCSHFNKKL